ncbi:sugar transferase [Mucilaginibacter phyllosphaerae]|uniref:Sugar transferase n=2 Tax=Mucilaginibacter phyllosphaerae TaxID=1812349 RepID=A0A4Y8AAZ7_9SPHI|nr:sugar transferase [Mucilaginibacter phyllosphaerae]TEW65085.1 sugar transferase [Mucilaginibacter phyllosphaerae]
MRYSKLLKPFTFLCDLAMLNIALSISSFLVVRYYSTEAQTANFILLSNLTWVSIASLTKNYTINRPLVLSQNLNNFLSSIVYHLVLVLGIVYFFRFFEVSRLQMLFTYMLFVALIVIERSFIFTVLDYIRKKGFNNKQILVIGNDDVARRMEKSFMKHPEYGYNFTKNLSEEALANFTKQGLFDHILETNVSEIFICYTALDQDFLKSLVDFGDQNSIKIKFVPDLLLENSKATIINYGNLPVIQLSGGMELSFKIVVFKRCFDVLFSLAVMIPGLPVFVLLTLITKLTSKGPVFYAQERIGKNNKPFRIYKFRSMHVNSEKLGPQLSRDHDPRITKWGRVIRKSRLDELPQFWNVLKGDMSVVGPRPERQFFIEQLMQRSPNYKKLLRLKPGLTSMGQVNYGYAENVDQMCNRVRYDLLYLNNINFNSEMGVILKTIKVMAQLKGK